MTAASKICHIEAVIRAEAWYTEAGGYMLTGTGTIIVGVAGKRRRLAGNINHLTLPQRFIKVLCEPDGPMITQSLLSSSLAIFVHYKCPKNLLLLLCANRQI